MFKKNTDENKELEDLKARCDEYLNGWKRAKADYENLKKDTEKRISELMEYSSAGVILELIPIYNHLKLAIQHIPEVEQNSEWGQGISHIKKEFEDFFKSYEIEEIKTKGEKFNPAYHEAVGYEESEQEEDIIIKEVQPGYQIKDKVFLPAKVIVSHAKVNSKKPSPEKPAATPTNITNNKGGQLLQTDSPLKEE